VVLRRVYHPAVSNFERVKRQIFVLPSLLALEGALGLAARKAEIKRVEECQECPRFCSFLSSVKKGACGMLDMQPARHVSGLVSAGKIFVPASRVTPSFS